MKSLLTFFYAIILLSSCVNSSDQKSEGDSTLNGTLIYHGDTIKGVDEFGMKKYILAFLKAGPARDQDSATVIQIQRAHLDNIKKMANEGKLVLAGPFLDDWDTRGIYIFNVETLEEARELTASDPAIRAGRLIMELHPWYGSAALLEINKIHKEIARKEI